MTEKALAKIDEALEEHRKKGYNVLVPTMTIQEISPLHKPIVEIVKISANPKDKEVYEPVRGTGEWAFTAVALQKIAYAAGITWNWNGSKRVDDGSDPDIVSYRMVAAVKKEDGTWREQVADYTLDLKVIEEEVTSLYKKKAEVLSKEGKRPWTEDAKRDYVEAGVRRDMLQKRKFRFQLAQTGAMNRVIRKILGLKSTYSQSELAKPFVVPKIAFHPNINDPEIRRMLMKQGSIAAREIFGVGYGISAGLPAPGESAERHEVDDSIDVDGTVVGESGSDSDHAIPGGEEEFFDRGESARVDFSNQAKDDQIKSLDQLMRRKGYDSNRLKKPLEEFTQEQRIAFYDHLVALEDNEEIPF